MTDDLRFPTGKFHFDPDVTAAERAAGHRRDPHDAGGAARGRRAVSSDAQLDTPYRPGGWTSVRSCTICPRAT